MTAFLVRLASAVVRAWTRAYTRGMPRSVRDARRAEVESDLWESWADEAAGAALPLQILGRLVFGVFDDLSWRVEHVGGRSRIPRAPVVLTVAALAVLACVWVGLAIGSVERPQPPAA